jgi:RNA polymerase sigma-70 factor (ECF subfamily)
VNDVESREPPARPPDLKGMMTVADDPALHLVARARAGAEDAFDALIRPLLEPAQRLAYAMLRDHHAAEDAVQEATLKAWRSFKQVREATTLRPWYLKIVANECRRAARGRWWRVLRFPELPAGSSSGPDDAVVGRIDLLEAFAKLGVEQRLTLCLAYYMDLPYEEIARLLNVREGTVKSRVSRATRRLAVHMGAAEANR